MRNAIFGNWEANVGWEAALSTVADLAGSLIKSHTEQSNAKAQADSIIAEGNIQTKNKAREVMARAGAQRVSFLNSGLTLEGTPTNVIDQTFKTGLEDINQIGANYNNKAKTVVSAARTSAISGLASSLGGLGVPGGGGSGGGGFNDQAAYALNNAGFGNTAYNMLDGS